MVILGNTACGHLETENKGKHMVAGPSGDKNSVAVMLDFENDSWKTIESVIFFFLPFDIVNHIVVNKARGQEERKLKLWGAIQPHEVKRQVYWENVWYSREIVTVKLMRIDISYTDGSMESLSGHQIHFDKT